MFSVLNDEFNIFLLYNSMRKIRPITPHQSNRQTSFKGDNFASTLNYFKISWG